MYMYLHSTQGCADTTQTGFYFDLIVFFHKSLYFTEDTKVCLELYNNTHVQQALAIVSQSPELMEVLKIQLEVTEGQEPAGAPPQINPVVKAAIKLVNRR